MNGSGLWAKSFVNFMIGCLNILYVPAPVPMFRPQTTLAQSATVENSTYSGGIWDYHGVKCCCI